ncbi:MAG: hypothetical protein HRT35_01330 [Algicola sp.]|nr:hypothetical protein [Algicola sp.]
MIKLITWLTITLSFTLLLTSCNSSQTPLATTSIDCATTSTYTTAPQRLSQSCLYSDSTSLTVSSQLKRFTPNYQLWSDGADKLRWIYLPPGTQVNTDDPDRWVFPVGTQFFKQFSQIVDGDAIKVETRHLQKTYSGEGVDSWLISTYLWNAQQTDAMLSDGASDVLGSDHDIPTQQNCIDCHKGNTDFILGFDAIQLSDKQGKNAFGHGPKRQSGELALQQLISTGLLTNNISQPVLPGNALEQKTLGYLHANCGNCHNPLGHAADNDAAHLKMRHELAFTTLEATDVYKTAVNQPTQNFTVTPYIAMGAQDEELALYQSAMFVRMNSVDETYRMPLLAREKVDYMGLDLVHQWLMTLPTPQTFEFNKEGKKTTKQGATLLQTSVALTGRGLQVEVEFFDPQQAPPVYALYWPEDKSLNSTPVMDHKAGYFTEKLLLGSQGSTLSLKNSDEVGHTIYVKDKKQNVKWQLGYMPPESSFEQKLFWQDDVFVEMKCRLHLYMSAWVGSISSQYHKIVELEEGQTFSRVEMVDYPEGFTELKIWLPKFEPINTVIEIGQAQSFELRKGEVVVGALRLSRFAL